MKECILLTGGTGFLGTELASRLAKAVAQSREILARMGVQEEKQFLGILNAGHPGGMLPLT